MNRIRVALFCMAAVLGGAALLWTPKPIEAAQQNATAGAETSHPVKQDADVHIDPGAASYAKYCVVCHGNEREGNLPGFPALVGIEHRMSEDRIVALIHAGKGRMPAFPQCREPNCLLCCISSRNQDRK